jgi:hypothetical protein
MSLSYGQALQLRRIEAELGRSDPRLGGMLGVFAWRYADQGMPAWEQMTSFRYRSRLSAWLTTVLVAVAAAIASLRGAVSVATRRTRARLPTSRPEHTRHGGSKQHRSLGLTERSSAMAYRRQQVVDLLCRLGYSEAAADAARVLSDPISVEQLWEFADRHRIAHDELVSRMGGSP